MGAPYHAESGWYGTTDETATTHTFTGTVRGTDLPASGDTILFWAYASDEGATKGGAAATADASGTAMSLVEYNRPGTQWTGFINVFKLVSDGTETAVTITWGEQSAWGKTLNVAFIDADDIDYSTIDLAGIATYDATSWSWSADADDNTLHCFGGFDNDDPPTSVLPTGDTSLSNAGDNNYRTGGWGVSGAATTSQTQADAHKGIVFNLNYDDPAVGTPLVCYVTTPTNNQVLPPDSAHPDIVVSITSGASNVKTVDYIINNTTDTTTWNQATTTWDAGSNHTNQVTSLNEATPYNHTFSTDLPDDVEDGKSYVIKARAADQSDTFGDYITRTYTSAAWLTAVENVHFTAEDDGPVTPEDPPEVTENVAPTVAVTSHASGQSVPSTDTDILFEGTAADSDGSVESVEYRYSINGGAFTTWAASTGDPLLGAADDWLSANDIGSGGDQELPNRGTVGGTFIVGSATGATIVGFTGVWSQVVPVTGVLESGDTVLFEVRSLDDDGDYSTTAAITVYVGSSDTTVRDTGTPADTYATAPATDFYRVLYADVQTGIVHGELPVTAFSWSEVLNGAGMLRASVVVDVDDPSPAYTAANLRPGSTALWVIRDGVILKGGILSAIQSVDLTNNRADLVAEGFFAYFRRRHIRVNVDYEFIDQLQIARNLIELAASDIRVETDSLTSGKLRQRRYRWWSMKPIADAVADLSAVDDGFDFRFAYTWTDNKPTATFTTMYPNTGYDTTTRFDIASNCSVASIELDGTQLGNTAISVGAGDGAETLESVLTDAAGLAGTPIFEDVQTYSSVSKVSTLAEHGADRLKRVAQPIDRIRLLLYQNQTPGLGSFQVGDKVTVTGSHGWWSASGTYRIVAYDATVQDGGEAVAVDVVPLKVFT